ncbi:MAG TPA: Spy/CpxP family protein refolding chaperone [Reyranella sp.]|nr:Spy/CpxP family protein refolding chaperone [Reyranella sp.]
MSIRPLFLAVPTALVAAAGLAWLSSATASTGGPDQAPQIAQAAPPAVPPPAAGGGMQPSPEHHFSPRKMCEVQSARRVGMRAFLKVRLDLKPEQMAAWNAFEKAADDQSAKDKTRCAALPTELKDRPNFADRYTMRENMMKSRLESIEAVKPSLLALYAQLSPEQKEILDRPMMGPHGHRRHGRG